MSEEDKDKEKPEDKEPDDESFPEEEDETDEGEEEEGEEQEAESEEEEESATSSERSSTPSEREKLEKLVSSETLDQLMQVVGSKGWIALWCCFTIIIISIFWGILGSIPVKITGNGISMTEAGPGIVVSQIEGTVVDVCTNSGRFIEKGDLIARLQNPILALNIEIQKELIVNKENSLSELTTRIETERQARRNTLLKEMETAQLALKTAQNNIPFLEHDLAAKQRLEKNGIIPLAQVEEAKGKLQQTRIDIENNNASITRIKEELARSYRLEEIKAKMGEIKEAKDELSRLMLQYSYLEIRAGTSGKVLEVVVAPGDRIMPGSEVASIETPLSKGEHLRYYATFPAQYGDLLDTGLPVEIEVSGVDPKLYGYLLGTMRFVSPYPVTQEEIVSDVRNKDIAVFLRGSSQLVYSAVIALKVDPSTKSGYKWSTGRGPSWELSSGTIGKVMTITERKPPIVYILPVEFSPFFYRLLMHEKSN
jgi:HlyD family secretion protein